MLRCKNGNTPLTWVCLFENPFSTDHWTLVFEPKPCRMNAPNFAANETLPVLLVLLELLLVLVFLDPLAHLTLRLLIGIFIIYKNILFLHTQIKIRNKIKIRIRIKIRIKYRIRIKH